MDDSESGPLNRSDEVATDDDKLKRRHHVSKILDDVLAEPEETVLAQTTGKNAKGKEGKHPMVLDLALAFGLIFAVGGFGAGLLHMYVNHLADQSLKRNDYQAAVALL